MKTTRAHITKEELLQAKVGDTFLLVDDIDTSKRYDGNSFINEMKYDGTLTISDISCAETHGVTTEEIYYKYTYDMIKAIFRGGKLLFGNYDGKIQHKISHDDLLNIAKDKGYSLTEEEIMISREHISKNEFEGLSDGSIIRLRLDLNHRETYGIGFNEKMNQFDKREHQMNKMVVESRNGDRLRIVGYDDFSFTKEMIESIVK